MIANEMLINLYVFRASIEDWVVRKSNGQSIVTINFCKCGERYVEVMK